MTSELMRLATFGEGASQRAALCEADWAPYERELEARGVECADSGVELHTWLDLLQAYHNALLECAGLDAVEPRKAAQALGEFVMATVGKAYVEAKAQLGGASELPVGLFEALFRNSPSGTLIYRLEDRRDIGSFRLVAANAAAARVSHPRIFEQVGMTLREVSPHLMDTLVPSHYAAAVLSGEARRWTSSADERGLPAKTHDARCFPLGGNYLCVMLDDVSEQRRVAEDVQRHVTELERSNRELDDFAYAASHDLKGPLQDVKNLSDWIAEDLGEALPANTARHIKAMRDRVVRMERLLDDLLAYSRAGREHAPVEQFTLRELLDEVIGMTRVPAGFRFCMEVDVRPLRAQRSPLAQVLRNIIGNALKHHDRDCGLIEIHARDSGDRVLISVRDDGPGIAPEYHGRVFRIFQTLRPRDEVEGSGIGLAIVKKVVETHGGTVGIASLGRGTAISFSWPRELIL